MTENQRRAMDRLESRDLVLRLVIAVGLLTVALVVLLAIGPA